MNDLITMVIVFAAGIVLGGAAIVSLSATGRRRRRRPETEYRTLPYKE